MCVDIHDKRAIGARLRARRYRRQRISHLQIVELVRVEFGKEVGQHIDSLQDSEYWLSRED